MGGDRHLFFGDIIFYYDLVFDDEKVYIYHYSLG